MKRIILPLIMLLVATTMSAQRKETILRDGWKFSRGEGLDATAPSQVGFNDSKWKKVIDNINMHKQSPGFFVSFLFHKRNEKPVRLKDRLMEKFPVNV